MSKDIQFVGTDHLTVKRVISSNSYKAVCGTEPFVRGVYKWNFLHKGAHWINHGLVERNKSVDPENFTWNSGWSVSSDM